MWKFRVFFFLVLVVCSFTVLFIWLVKEQGFSDWRNYHVAKVDFDNYGIPTISADSWEALIEAQGFVTASDRLWQMELLKRKLSGRLSEWFGEKTYSADEKMLSQDFLFYASQINLPKEQKKFCDLYVRGVNDFIDRSANSWGLEYSLLRVKPDKWSCVDVLLVAMIMGHNLTSSYEKDLAQLEWKEKLPQKWYQFLFMTPHPWSRPIFSKNKKKDKTVWPDLVLPAGLSKKVRPTPQMEPKGSNAWSYSDQKTAYLANDTHLKRRVPQTWYALRLRISAKEWVVGASIPGVPGVVAGMNPYFAWSITNLYDDNDHLTEETVRDGKYLVAGDQWLPIIRRKHLIRSKSGLTREVESLHTHKGPLLKSGDAFYSRNWGGFQKNAVQIPSVRLNRAKTWLEFNRTLDGIGSPSAAWLYVNRLGDQGMRASGLNVGKTSRVPVSGFENDWDQNIGPIHRRKFFKNKKRRIFIVTANNKHWDGEENWSAEDRQFQIRSKLSKLSEPTQTDMELLQLDSEVFFFNNISQFINKFGSCGPVEKHELRKMESIERVIKDLLVSKVQSYFEVKSDYLEHRYRAWFMALLKNEELNPFGMTFKDLADYACKNYTDTKLMWTIQHPFVGRVPFFGRLFKVREYELSGSKTAINAETGYSGPTFRMVWNLKEPLKSSWIFPVGQSGHIRSPHFRDMQSSWKEDVRQKVFIDDYLWSF